MAKEKRDLDTNGMWVVEKEGRVGIMLFGGSGSTLEEKRAAELAAKRAGIAEVHLVDKEGNTSLILAGVPVKTLRQAKAEEIPKKRRPDEKMLVALGYAE